MPELFIGLRRWEEGKVDGDIQIPRDNRRSTYAEELMKHLGGKDEQIVGSTNRKNQRRMERKSSKS